jgi:RNA polymerase sigma-70 factor, ECF subfamily
MGMGDMRDASEDVMRALYAEHGAALLGYSLRLTAGNRERAEDLVQEALIRAWRHPESLDPARGAVRPWLFAVVRNLAVDAHRARQARPVETGEDLIGAVTADDEIDRALDAWEVADALAALTEEHRSALVEVYYRGHSVAEAARVLGVPTGTVKSRTYYALRALRLVLQERGVVE